MGKSMKKVCTKSSFIVWVLLLAVAFLVMHFSAPGIAGTPSNNDCLAGRHEYTVTIRNSTEDSNAAKLFDCINCGFRYSMVLYSDIECNWGEWRIQRPATCSVEGIRYRICTATDNHHREYETIPTLTCRFEFISETPATCVTDGARNYSCVHCRASRTYVVPATGHQMETTQTPPTCESRGIRVHSCASCDHSFTEEFGEKSGHDFVSQITRQPTYYAEGVKTRTCSTCGYQYTQDIPRLVEQQEPFPDPDPPLHQCEFVAVSENPPSCLYDGYTKYICYCGEEKMRLIPAIGQSFGDWFVYQSPTRFSTGIRHSICTNSANCVKTEVIPALINFNLNMTDAIMIPINLLLSIALVMYLWADIYVLLWDLGKRGKIQKSKRMKIFCGMITMVALGAVLIIATAAIPSLPAISFTNLLSYVFLATLFVVAIICKPVTTRKRSLLDGNRGIHQSGAYGGELISMN